MLAGAVEASLSIALGLDHPIGGNIDVEFILLPPVVHDVHLAEPLPPLMLDFDFFD
jgi:hypothetical protein